MVESKLEVVQIYFDTATYDVVEKDQKVTCIGQRQRQRQRQ